MSLKEGQNKGERRDFIKETPSKHVNMPQEKDDRAWLPHWIFGFFLNSMTSCSINDTGCSLTKLPKHRSTTKGHPPRKCYPAKAIHQTWCSNRSGISMMYIRQWIEYKGDTHLTIWHPGHTWEVTHFQTHTHTQTMCNVSFMSEADAHDIILIRAWNQSYSKNAPRIRQWHKLNINLIFDSCLTQTCWIHLDTVLMFDQKFEVRSDTKLTPFCGNCISHARHRDYGCLIQP